MTSVAPSPRGCVSLLVGILCLLGVSSANGQSEPVRVFIFAGQSNMEGADSKAADVDRFPPFVGWAEPFSSVRYSYVLG